MIRRKQYLLLIAFLIVFGSGCTANDPMQVEQDFGKSVRNMIDAQIYNPDAATNPPAEPPSAFDGIKTKSTLEIYRGDVAKPKDMKKPINLDVVN